MGAAPQQPVRSGVDESMRRTAQDLRARIDELAGVATEAALARIPEYASAGDGFRRAYRVGAETALRGFLDVLEGRRADASLREAYSAIGAGEYREGRSLEALHAAIRVGARMGWRQLAGFAESACLPMSAVGEVADAIWAYVDDLVDAAADGYERARGTQAGEAQRRRLRLLDLLLADPPAGQPAVAAAAAAARWPVPRRVAAVALEGGAARSVPPVLPPDVLVDLDRPDAVLIVPDPESQGQTRMLVNTLRGYRIAVGPSVPPGAAGRSMRWARRALELARRGVITGDGPVWSDDHLVLLALFQDEALLASFVERRLRPLARLREAQRQVLAETLLAWLRHNMTASAVATELHVHPQTVRRRLRQLDELFGDQVQDPLVRFELQVALWADRALRAGRPRLVRAGESPVRAPERRFHPRPAAVRPRLPA